MQHLTVGVFHDDALGKELGKKGTLSDIAMYHRKTDDHIFTFMSPVEEKLSAKSQIISTIDAAVVVFSQMTRELGETILMLDLMGVKHGISVATPYATANQIGSLTQGTAIQTFHTVEKDPNALLGLLKTIAAPRDTASPVSIVVDHSFSVRGVGEVVLGFVKKGVVRKYDKLNLLPSGKQVIVRSIQVQDEDVETAEAGTRVGLAIKGATLEELGRGSVLTNSIEVRALEKMDLTFRRSSFYAGEVREGVFHATAGMQTNPVTLWNPREDSVVIESSKPIVHEPQDTILLLDLNAQKTRVIGKGTVCRV
jgi:selenocysteine-specific translation elongation factor